MHREIKKQRNMAKIEDIFGATKLTENGDIAFSTTNNQFVDLLFFAEYYSRNLNKVIIGKDEKSKIFSMMMRDPRFGLGYRAYGRKLMDISEVSIENKVKAGRFDDLLYPITDENLAFIKKEIENGNELAKKWMPRFSSSKEKKAMANIIAKKWGMSKKEYNKFVKVNTTESYLTERDTEKINFSQVPSLASIKYATRFLTGNDTSERYQKWQNDVKAGKAKVNVSTTTCYDIYKNMNKIDADMFFDKLEKIQLSCVPIVDVSGSMYNSVDAIGKALSIGYYLSVCSTCMPNKFISFSSKPELVSLSGKTMKERMVNIERTDWGCNTDLGAVMDLLSKVDENLPDYLVILSDMEFDSGSSKSKNELMNLWKSKGYKTKIVWWNFNARNTTAPEMDKDGNIFMSGYSPMLLKYLSLEFDGSKFIDNLIKEYKEKVLK